jgi:hypothetical protein
LGDYVQHMFWDQGCEPTVDSIMLHCSTDRKPSGSVTRERRTGTYPDST